jgi:hypothetical protein
MISEKQISKKRPEYRAPGMIWSVRLEADHARVLWLSIGFRSS